MDWQAVILSLKLATLTTVFLMVGGLPLAYLMSYKKGHLTSLAESFISAPLVLPPTVLGFYLLVALSKIHLAFTFSGLLLASIIYSLPFALQPFLASFQGVNKRLIEASWVSGVGRVPTFLKVTMPLAMPGILSGAILSFAHTLGEFGVVLMIGGNIPGVTRTLSISIYDHMESLDYAQANRTAAFLLAISLVSLIMVSHLRKRSAFIV
jgi:molybdate transport system permease protein